MGNREKEFEKRGFSRRGALRVCRDESAARDLRE
jgi:hypothetical protein